MPKSPRDILQKLKSLNEAFNDFVEEDQQTNTGAGPSTSKNVSHNDCKALYGDKGATSSVSDRLRAMFAPYDKGSPAKKIRNEEFAVKQLILLPFHNVSNSPRGNDFALLEKLKLLKNSVSMSKLLTSEELKSFLRAEFAKYLTENVPFEILKKQGSTLLVPELQEGCTLTGLKASTIFGGQKMFLRPCINIKIDPQLMRETLRTSDPPKKSSVFASSSRKNLASTCIFSSDEDDPAEMSSSRKSHPSPSCTGKKTSSRERCFSAGRNVCRSTEEDSDSSVDFSLPSRSKKSSLTSSPLDKGSKVTSSYLGVSAAGTSCSVDKLIFSSDKEKDVKDESSMPADAAESDWDGLGGLSNDNVENNHVIEISDDDDDYINDVLLQLPNEEPSSSLLTPKQEIQDFKSARVALQEGIDKKEMQAVLVVNRGSVFQSVVLGFKIMGLDPKKPLDVKFIDKLNLPEPAADLGGPKKEFFRLAFQDVCSGSMFEGPTKEKNLMLCYDSLRNEEYKWFGVLCAVAVAHTESPVPNFFSEELYNIIISNNYKRDLSIEKVAEIDVLNELEQISKCSSVEELKQVADRSVILSLAGISTNSIKNLARKEKIIEDCLNYYLNDRMQPVFHQFIEGLKTLGLLDMMRQNPSTFKDAFVFREPVTAEVLKAQFKISFGDHTDETLARCNEVATSFLILLHDIEAGNCTCSLEDVLVFFSACDQIPLGGFHHQPTLKFHTDASLTYPDSSTCLNELILPISTVDYYELRDNICPYFKNYKILGKF